MVNFQNMSEVLHELTQETQTLMEKLEKASTALETLKAEYRKETEGDTTNVRDIILEAVSGWNEAYGQEYHIDNSGYIDMNAPSGIEVLGGEHLEEAFTMLANASKRTISKKEMVACLWLCYFDSIKGTFGSIGSVDNKYIFFCEDRIVVLRKGENDSAAKILQNVLYENITDIEIAQEDGYLGLNVVEQTPQEGHKGARCGNGDTEGVLHAVETLCWDLVEAVNA